MPRSREKAQRTADTDSAAPKRRRKDRGLLERVPGTAAGLVSSDGISSLRRCIASLYALGKKLTTPTTDGRFRYAAPNIHTDEKKGVTSDQVWSQLSILTGPVVASIGGAIEEAAAFKKQGGGAGELKTKEKTNIRGASDHEESLSDIDGEESVDDENDDSDVEGELDAEISAALDKRREAKQKKKEKKKERRLLAGMGEGADRDGWRYALGKMDEGGEEDEEVEAHEDDEETASERRRRNDGEDEIGEDGQVDEIDDEDNEDQLALKELYGDDFDADGARLGDDEEDEEDDEEKEEEEVGLFQADDGQYWGDEDILNDGRGEGEEMDEAEAPAGGGGGGLPEGLDNPDLTELQRRRMLEEHAIRRLEESRVYNAPWSLAGEAGASHRPKDSLLDEVLDFEHAMKAVPVVTEHSTLALEERIRRRIKNKAFDDVERKSSKSVPQDLLASSARGTRRDSAADAERSKLSLMDLYEKEYLEKIRRAEQAEGQQTTAAVDPLTEIEKDELRAVQMWKRLAQHLDALSNFFYAPKPVQQDLDARVRAVEHQAPAIVIESVGNFAASRAAALAPQDLYRHDIRNKFVGVATDEMDPREKRALRRAKKDSFAATKTRKTKKAVDKAAARALATERKKGEGKRERVSQATKANPS